MSADNDKPGVTATKRVVTVQSLVTAAGLHIERASALRHKCERWESTCNTGATYYGTVARVNADG